MSALPILSPAPPIEPTGRPATLRDAARELVAEALIQAATKVGHPLDGEADPAGLSPDFREYLKRDLAVGVAGCLAEHDGEVRAIYTFEPSANADAEDAVALPADSVVHLLVLVNRRTAALDALVAGLNDALIEALRERGLPGVPKGLLDVNPITPDDVRRGSGLAGLLGSVFVPPIKVWGS